MEMTMECLKGMFIMALGFIFGLILVGVVSYVLAFAQTSFGGYSYEGDIPDDCRIVYPAMLYDSKWDC